MVNAFASLVDSSATLTTRISLSFSSSIISLTSSIKVSTSSSSTSSRTTSSPSIFSVIGFPALSAFAGAAGAEIPCAARRRASSSALVGNNLRPAAFLAAFACSSAKRANLRASSSAFVGKRCGPFEIFLTAVFFAATFLAGAFLAATFFATAFLTTAFFVAFAPFLGALVPATDHPLVCLTYLRGQGNLLTHIIICPQGHIPTERPYLALYSQNNCLTYRIPHTFDINEEAIVAKWAGNGDEFGCARH
ncbi:unannotated protein [freshwater metagenome]|uniref:Unannotated protein n=1 Tax=freshwater metagenome TaxID=449393 RepID=A0A6J6BWR1_9ZZZZ